MYVHYFFLGLIHLPPVMSEMRMNTIAAYEKAVLSMLIPIVRNAMPRIRKTIETLRLFSCMMKPYFNFTSEKSVKSPLKRLDGWLFNVISKKSIKYASTISVTRLPLNGPLRPSCGAIGDNSGRSLKS